MTRYDAPPTLHPGRWTLHRAGIINVWHYTDVEFRAHGGRLILRGTNGAGKSRAMEMLVPFLLDADKRRMDATGAGKVSVEDLMRAGAEGATNRLGYLWLELARDVDDGEPEYLTIGAYIRFSTGTARADVRYFTTGLRVGHDLRLVDEQRVALPREALTDLVGAERITESPEAHREAVRTQVFGLHGDSGRERFDGLRQLLHTLRAPDVGNRIDEGQLPRILRDAMPPLSQASLDAAGEKLDGLTETRQELDRLERSLTLVGTFLGVYQRYSADVLRGAADAVLTAVAEADAAEQAAASAATEVEALASRRAEAIGQQSAHAEAAEQLQTSINGMRSRNIFKTADDLRARDAEVAALGTACDACLGAASAARRSEKDAVEAADAQAGVIRDRAELATHAVQQLHGAAGEAGLAGTGLDRVTATVASSGAETALVRVDRHGDLATVERPRPAAATISPEPGEVGASAQAIGTAARERGEHAQRRRLEAGRLDQQLRQVEALERDAQSATERVQQEQTSAQQLADQWAQAAAELSGRWREHIASADAHDPEWPPALAAVLADPDAALSDDPSIFDPEALDRAAEQAARPAVDATTRALAELDQQRRADEQARATLESEATELRAARDPLPPDAPWLDPGRGGQPLWRCIDFRADLDGYTRASLEAALLAAGLLTASVTADRAVVAATGEILVSAARPAPGRSLTATLIADPTGPLPTDAVTAVLSAIGLDDDDAPVAVYGDGRWRNGPLRGRHQQRDAGYIGATARAARRAARLAEIDRQLAELAARAEQRRASDADLRERARRLRAWVDGAPRTRSVVTARDAVLRAEQRAEAAQREAAGLGALARERRTAWSAEHRVHIETCRLHVLPLGEADLGRVAGAARDAERTHLGPRAPQAPAGQARRSGRAASHRRARSRTGMARLERPGGRGRGHPRDTRRRTRPAHRGDHPLRAGPPTRAPAGRRAAIDRRPAHPGAHRCLVRGCGRARDSSGPARDCGRP